MQQLRHDNDEIIVQNSWLNTMIERRSIQRAASRNSSKISIQCCNFLDKFKNM